jgi:hypothetical protein
VVADVDVADTAAYAAHVKAVEYRMGRGAALALSALFLAMACQSAPTLPELNFDTTPLGLVALQAGLPPAQVTLDSIVSRISGDAGSRIAPVGLGRRWSIRHQRTVYALTYRLASEDTFLGRVVDDQTGEVLFVFDEASLRAFNVLPEE